MERWDDIDGFAVSRNMPPLGDLPLGRFCSFIWWFSTNGAEQKEVDKFKARLWQPPAGSVVTDERSPWSPKQEASAFSALKAGLAAR